MAQSPVPQVNKHGITILFEAENPTIEFVPLSLSPTFPTLSASRPFLTDFGIAHCRRCSILFVHGFTGHPEKTWTSDHLPERNLPLRKRPVPNSSDVQPPPSKISRIVSSHPQQPTGLDKHELEPPPEPRGVYWPYDLVPTILPNSRVLTYGYDTNVRSRFGSSPMNKKSGAPSRPLVFVAHSLGGLISKVALIRASDPGQHAPQAHLGNIAQSTVSVLFFGTPHQGADPFNVIHHILKRLATAIFHYNDSVVQTLLQGGDYLRLIQERFMVIKDESSCISNLDLETTRHIGKNHRDMVRFSGNGNPEYRKVASTLRSIYDHIQIPSETYLQDKLSSSNEPFPANRRDSDSPVTADVLARRQELMDLLYFNKIDARLLSLRDAHNKTCIWFLENKKYRQWLDLQNINNHHSFLWIKGKPGSRKSILMKFLEKRNRLSATQDPKRIFASFFFYAPGEHLEKSTLVLNEFNLNAWRVIKKSGWQNEALKKTIERAIYYLGDRDLSVFIDALDECRDDDVADMVSFFEDLGEQAAEKSIRLRICFSSRHYLIIELKCGFEIILEEQDEHSKDIARYISSKLKLPKSKRTEDFRKEVLENAGGRVDQLQKCLNTIPTGLDNLFDIILARDNEDMDELRFCIQLILFAIRPVTLTEYFFALRPAGDKDLHDSWAAKEVDRNIMGRFALSSSKGLAEVTKTRKKDKDPTVQFIHKSVRDFLFSENGRRRLWPTFNRHEFIGFGHDALKLRCLGEIEAHQSQNSQANTRSAPDLIQMWPFLRYATDNILLHANQAQQYGVSQDGFLFQFSGRQQDWVKLYNVFEKFKSRHYRNTVDIIYILAEHGLDSLLQIHPRLSSHLDIRYGLASLSPDLEFAAGIEDCVMALSCGRDYKLVSLKDFFSLLPEIGHIQLMDYYINNFPGEDHWPVIKGYTNRARTVSYSPDGQTIASASSDRTIRLWDTATGVFLQTLRGHGGTVCAVAFSPDGQTVASASYDKTVRL
ncbi:hypothetical protein QBC43DRAFT_382350 [Cladorrhinum sp. PSN259]|nr:hypothetical protein QBC43DRAFT_382350 [Cladorrhinum sp. PSN259]